MADELTTFSHDSIVPILWDINHFIGNVDRIIEHAEVTGDPSEALDAGIILVAAQQVSWLVLAKLVYELNERWGEVFESDHEFITVASARWNKSEQYIRRLLEIWTWVIVEPGHGPRRLKTLLSKPYGALRQLVGMCRAGEMTTALWQRVDQCVTQQEIRQLREDVRGLHRGALAALKIMIENDGTLKGRRGDAPYEIGGVLNMGSDSPTVRAMVDRIIHNSGIFHR